MESQSDYSTRGCLLGKTVSPRIQQLEDDFIKNGGCFKEFRIGDLFFVEGTKSLDAGKVKFEDIGINFVGRTNEFNGVQGKISRQDYEPNSSNTITATVIGNYKYVKYQEEPYYCSQNINKLTPKFEINQLRAIYFMVGIKKFVELYNGQQAGYLLEQLKDSILYVPINIKSQIDFQFMESYIRELEQERIRELEQERIRELDAYLKATGLNDYELTPEEKNSIEIMSNGGIKYNKFRIGDLFDIRKGKRLTSVNTVNSRLQQLEDAFIKNGGCFKKFKIGDLFDIKTGRDLIIGHTKNGSIPLISNQNTKNGIAKYISRVNERIIFDHKKTISLADRGVFYATTQIEDFHIGTRVKALIWKNGELPEVIRLYLTSSINKLQEYFNGYLTNATDKLPLFQISLPVIDNKLAFDYMENYIQELEQIQVQELKQELNRELNAYIKVIGLNGNEQATDENNSM